MTEPVGPSTDWPDGQCPFLPAPGYVPAYLAGRETEQRLIRSELGRLKLARPGRDIVIYGPRGNGKTALMAWALDEAQDRGIGTVHFSSKEIESKEWLARHLAILPSWLTALSGLSVLGIGIKTRDPTSGRISNALARRARRRGLVVAVDEAHTLEIDAGQHLLHAVQALRFKKMPVILLLAGTPDLPRHLSSMEASFWNRSKILPLGRLGTSGAADAIRIPVEAEGRSISSDALANVVSQSHGYPFFLQMWGEMLWEETSDPARPASLDDVDRARARFEKARNIYYRDRYVELQMAELAFVAARLSLAFTGRDKLTDLRVDETIRLALESEGRRSDALSVLTARARLHDLGYIWSVGDELNLCFEPGIPSLMRYVLRCSGIDSGHQTA